MESNELQQGVGVEEPQSERKEVTFDDLPEKTRQEIKALREENKQRRLVIDELQSKLSEYETKLNEILSEKKAVEQEQLKKRGEYERLYQEATERLKELEIYEKKYKEYEAKLEQERLSLLAKLPEEKQALYKSAPIEIVRDVVELFNKETAISSPAVEQNAVGNPSNWGEMTPEQREAILGKNPKLMASYEEWLKNII